VEVRDREQTLEALIHPLHALWPLTLRAVPVTTGVVGDPLMSAAVAVVDVPTERSSATGCDMAQHFSLSRRQPMLAAIVLAVKPDHVGDLQERPSDAHNSGSAEDL